MACIKSPRLGGSFETINEGDFMQGMKALLGLLTVLAVGDVGRPAQSQVWPQRPVRIIVPFAPGGNTDVIARIIAPHLGEAFGRQFVVENRPGAAGAIGGEVVARAPADGYTLLMATLGQIAIAPALANTSYDPQKDFVAISKIGSNPFVLTVHPS